MVSLLLLGCGLGLDPTNGPAVPVEPRPAAPRDGGGGGGEEPAPTRMDPVRALARASLDLRGVRPSDAEIAAVRADPEAYAALVAGFVEDPRFGDRILSLYAERLLTLTETIPVDAGAYGLDGGPAYDAAVGEEPLRLIAHVATEDLPYTELATGDWTMANEVLGAMWPLDYPEDGEGWQVARYTDGRPAAGILATNGLWWRYGSTESNANRARANAAARILLCHDHLSRPITFDRSVDLLDEEAVSDALASDPACVSCHVSLDPLASYFYGFWWEREAAAAEASRYRPEREALWAEVSGVAPGFYGRPGGGLGELGEQIAADPRFPNCAVRVAMEGLLRRPVAYEDTDRLTTYREAFLQEGLRLKPLYAAVAQDPDYLAGDGARAGAVPTRLLTPDQLASAVEDLTGWRWTQAGADMLRTDEDGVRTLAGGIDGYTVTAVATSPNATWMLVSQRVAEAAAAWAVGEEARQAPADRRLFTAVDLDARTPDEATIREQLRLLLLRVHSRVVEPDDPDVDALLELWRGLAAADGGRDDTDPWTGVLVALLRDPDFVLY